VCVIALPTYCVGCIFVPCIYSSSAAQANAQRLVITNKRITHKSKVPACFGICGTNDRAESTDLEKIQNIDQNQNCMQKCCGLSVTQIQTGGI
jgi:hypothetical protein